jgi:hypothetical protein
MKLANQANLDFAHSQEAMRRLERKLKYIKHQWKGSTLFIQMIDGVCPLCYSPINGTHSHQVSQEDIEHFEEHPESVRFVGPRE